MEQQNNAAKFAFLYMLSLVALIFMALSAGIIVFQIINKNIADIPYALPGSFDAGALKFAISAIIIAAPIYYLTLWQINKNLFAGLLPPDSEIRKWLTYFILFISSVVMLGWLVAVIYNFLDGELTIKFVLKALTAFAIAAAIFSYYFYDIKRRDIAGARNKVVKIFFFASLAVVVAALASAFFFVESPAETRARKMDNAVLEKFDRIDSALNTFYNDSNKLPSDLNELTAAKIGFYLTEEDLQDSATKEKFSYKATGVDAYELCAAFRSSNKIDDIRLNYYRDRWPHDAGYQCLGQKVRKEIKDAAPARP